MQYRKFPGTDITASTLGMGCMRLPRNADQTIDETEAIRIIRHGIDNGITYVDTAYGYHEGQSERLVAKALKDGYREKVTLTTKLPQWLVKEHADMEKLLDEQLGKLQVDYVDFYLVHSVAGPRFKELLELGICDFMDEMIAKGKIRYPGFSFHGDAQGFRDIIDAYPRWKLAQVQMNILDEFNQATLEGMRYAQSKGVGIVVMEPLRGGSLAYNPPKEIANMFDALGTDMSHIEWCFRWLYDCDAVITILSGMSNMEQLEDNLRIFEGAVANCLTAEQRTQLGEIRKAYEARIRVGCTDCKYCMPCPKGVEIPDIYRALDSATMFDHYGEFKNRYAKLKAENHDASQCIKCGKCMQACPQHIDTPNLMQQINAEFGM